MQQFVGSMVEEPLQLVDVIVQHGEQSPAAVPFKEIHLQLLEVVIGLQPQAVLRALGQIAPEDSVEVFEQRFRCPYQKGQHRQCDQLTGHRGDPQLGEPGGVLLHHHVDGQSDQDRRGQIKHLVDHGTACSEPDPPSVRPQVLKQSLQR